MESETCSSHHPELMAAWLQLTLRAPFSFPRALPLQLPSLGRRGGNIWKTRHRRRCRCLPQVSYRLHQPRHSSSRCPSSTTGHFLSPSPVQLCECDVSSWVAALHLAQRHQAMLPGYKSLGGQLGSHSRIKYLRSVLALTFHFWENKGTSMGILGEKHLKSFTAELPLPGMEHVSGAFNCRKHCKIHSGDPSCCSPEH